MITRLPPAPVATPAEPAPGAVVPQTPDATQGLPQTPEAALPPLPTTPQGGSLVLLLPLQSVDFHAAAQAFEDGFNAAAQTEPGNWPIVVRATDASPENILTQYSQSLGQGARVVIGPMTRNGVSAIANSGLVMTPTLSLNQPEGNAANPPDLYFFGLSVENEARIQATQAFNDGCRAAAAVGFATPLARRSRDAFLDQWRAQNGNVVAIVDVPVGANSSVLRELASTNPECVFLAAGFDEARLLRPYLPTGTPVYATSQINSRGADPLRDFDLNGVHFIDMPWILAPNDPNVMLYPPAPGYTGDLARFYALGIDAYRVATLLAAGRHEFEFQGVTGNIKLSPLGAIERHPWPATYRDGVPVAIAPSIEAPQLEAPQTAMPPMDAPQPGTPQQ